MKKIAVTSDSTCALSRVDAAKIGLEILPLNVIVDNIEYHDGIDIDLDKLAKMMRGGSVIKTSTPTPYEIETFFDSVFAKGYDEIIHFTISSKLSSMFELFTTKCKEKYGDKVLIIDSRAVCVYMLNHVLTARKWVEEGFSKEEIGEKIKERISTEDLTFIPETLTYLKRGGRISPTVALIGNLIGIKPILKFVDGGIDKDSTTRNIKKSLHDLALLKKKENYDPEHIAIDIVTFDTRQTLVDFTYDLFKTEFPNFDINISSLSINVGAHTGPGTIGVGFHHKVSK